MAKVCARSRRSNGKIGDCEQSILLLVPFAVFLLCFLTGSSCYCNVSFYFFGHFGCHVKLHHSKAHSMFKLRKHGGRTFYKPKLTISSVVNLPESTGSVALRHSRKTLRSMRVFETRVATGSQLFSFLTCLYTTTLTLLSIFSPL